MASVAARDEANGTSGRGEGSSFMAVPLTPHPPPGTPGLRSDLGRVGGKHLSVPLGLSVNRRPGQRHTGCRAARPRASPSLDGRPERSRSAVNTRASPHLAKRPGPSAQRDSPPPADAAETALPAGGTAPGAGAVGILPVRAGGHHTAQQL